MADVGQEVAKVIISTMEARTGKIIDNISNKNGVIRWMKIQDEREKEIAGEGGGRYEIVDGGYEFVEDLDYGTNDTVDFYDDDQDIAVTPQEPFMQAKYAQRTLAGSVHIRLKQLAQNKGKAAVFNLLRGLEKNLERSYGNKLEEGMFNDGSDTNSLDGLPVLVNSSPSTQTNVGNINPTTQSWWRNQVGTAIAAIGGAAGLQSLTQFYLNTSGGPQDLADLGVTTAKIMGLIMGYFLANGRFDLLRGDETLLKLRIKNITFENAVMLYSEANEVNVLRFLNTNYLKFKVLKDGNFKMTEMIRPVNGLYQAGILYAFCNLTCSNRERQGYVSITG